MRMATMSEQAYGYYRGQSKADFWQSYQDIGADDAHIARLWENLQAWRADVNRRVEAEYQKIGKAAGETNRLNLSKDRIIEKTAS